MPLAALLLAATPPVAWADTDIEAEETDESINSAVKALRQDQHEEAEVRQKLDRLEQQNRDLQFQKRTGAPFRSERSLRNDLRRNEAQQGWEKSESRRLDYEIRRQQRSIDAQSREFRRAR